MNLSKERMDHITRFVEGGFPLKTDEVEDLHGMNYHLYCLCDTYQAMKIRAENEAETLKAENEMLRAVLRRVEKCTDGAFPMDGKWQVGQNVMTLVRKTLWPAAAPGGAAAYWQESAAEPIDTAMAQEQQP